MFRRHGNHGKFNCAGDRCDIRIARQVEQRLVFGIDRHDAAGVFFVDQRFQRAAVDFIEVGRGANDGDGFRMQQSLDGVVHCLDSQTNRKGRSKITAADSRVKPDSC